MLGLFGGLAGGEKAPREGLRSSKPLPGRETTDAPVVMGARPRRDDEDLLETGPCQGEGCDLVLLAAGLDAEFTAAAASEGSWEVEEGRLIDEAPTLGGCLRGNKGRFGMDVGGNWW